MFRWFTHEVLHIHRWSKWGIPHPLTSEGGLSSAFLGIGRTLAQSRFCEICNITEQNVVGFEYDTIASIFQSDSTEVE